MADQALAPIEWWTGPIDWLYCPAEFLVPTRTARRAVTSHDVLQTLRFESPRRRDLLARVLEPADLILSVSRFNTEQLLDAFPACRGRVAYVPNGGRRPVFRAGSEPRPETGPRGPGSASEGPVSAIRGELPAAEEPGASDQCRRPAARSRSRRSGVGAHRCRRQEAARPFARRGGRGGRRALIRMPGYRQGRALRAVYAEATALVFPSLCESFGIPAVEAMSQGLPIALADSTALPEIGGEAAWYFNPYSEDAIADSLRRLLDDSSERTRRAMLGRAIAGHYRWQNANDLLVEALLARRTRSS